MNCSAGVTEGGKGDCSGEKGVSGEKALAHSSPLGHQVEESAKDSFVAVSQGGEEGNGVVQGSWWVKRVQSTVLNVRWSRKAIKRRRREGKGRKKKIV